MYDEQQHPLLAQVPLAVSPFVSLPTATTLPYTYKSLPSTLPISSTGPEQQPGQAKPKYIVSSSGGHAAHPDDILASCKALDAHLKKLRDDAQGRVNRWEKDIRERELAEKRRLAPGWLDSDARILEPQKSSTSVLSRDQAPTTLMDVQEGSMAMKEQTIDDAAGQELDRAFGTMSMNHG